MFLFVTYNKKQTGDLILTIRKVIHVNSIPQWVEEALRNRFDEIAAYTIKTNEVRHAYANFREKLYAYHASLSGSELNRFLELEDYWNLANAMEKEMLYKLGVQDGAILPLYLTPSRKTV
jgi:hypothetical protein